jgi:hypothetical protein
VCITRLSAKNIVIRFFIDEDFPGDVDTSLRKRQLVAIEFDQQFDLLFG